MRDAGALALSLFRTDLKNWTKGASSPVSEADIAVNDLLEDRLRSATPDYGWLSEESADDESRLGMARVWIVDPIDGTRGYLAGREDWCVSVALVENNSPVLAAVFAPASAEFFFAVRGKGAVRNDARLHETAGIDLDFSRVAEGRLDAAFAGGQSHDWDLAAANLIVQEANGNMTTVSGDSILYNRQVVTHGVLVAAGRDRHASIVEHFRHSLI